MEPSKRDSVLSKNIRVAKLEKIERTARSFSPSEKLLFLLFVFLLAGSAFVLLLQINNIVLTNVPARGGSLSEGIVGSPRFVNPLLAVSDADRDLTALIYSGLLKATPEGDLIEDLAERYTISPDGLTYSFVIRKNATFHDGTPVTADDVVFTMQKAQDAVLKSPKRANWEGIAIQKVDDRQVNFILARPYSPFLENATLGILPKHVWQEVNAEQFAFSQLNIEPVGSGPFKIKKVKRNAASTPTSYELVPFPNYALGEPFISNLFLRFYANEKELLGAYEKKEIGSINSISPEVLSDLVRRDSVVKRAPLPRIFAVFFNQNQADIFSHIEVRAALNAAIDKSRIVEEVLGGYGSVINGPFPPEILGQGEQKADESGLSGKELAVVILERNNWSFNQETGLWEKSAGKEKPELRFSLSTSNTPDLKAAAEIIKEELSLIGIPVEVKIFETVDLNQNVIRPRRYDALLFGEIVGRDLDLFAFWHSSQRNDPGLNIAQYANITADKLLEDVRTTSVKKEREKLFEEFQKEINLDIPAVFLYSPDFVYVVPKNILGLKLGSVTTPGERFLNIYEWHFETNKVWAVFVK